MAQTDVKGYEGNPGYDGPYHPSAELDPDIKFIHGGDVEAADKLEKAAFKQAEKFHAERKKQTEDSLESWELEQGKTAVVQKSSDYPDVKVPGSYQPPITTDGKTFEEEQKTVAARGPETTLKSVDNDADGRSSSSSSSNAGSRGSSSSTDSVKPAKKTTAAKKTTPSKPTVK